MDPGAGGEAPWTGEARREQEVLLGVLCFLAMENLRDANELFRMFKKVPRSRCYAWHMSHVPCHVLIAQFFSVWCFLFCMG